jgi:hypothetical protein
MSREKAAAVLDALEQGAPDVPTAYGQAAAATSSPVEEVAAESQAEVICAASRLREMGVSMGAAVSSMASLTRGPPEAIQALVAQRWQGGANRTDARQRYRKIGVVCPGAFVDACNAALAAAWAAPLSDPRGVGRAPHALYAQCLADNAELLNHPLFVEGVEVGRGLLMQATPADVVRMREAAEGAGAVFVEPQEDDDATKAAYEAQVAALGWSTVAPEENL